MKQVMDPAFVHGEVLAVQQLIFVLAKLSTPPGEFLPAALAELEHLQIALLGEQVPDAVSRGVDLCERQLRAAFP